MRDVLINTSYGVMPEHLYHLVRLEGVTLSQFDALFARYGKSTWGRIAAAIRDGEHLEAA